MDAVLTLLERPADEPLSLEDAKLHLRLERDTEDTLLLDLLGLVRERAEDMTGRAILGTQTWEARFEHWPACRELEIPRPPLIGVESVTYLDQDGNPTVWDEANYIVDTYSHPGRIVLAYGASWPSEELYPSLPIVVKFTCGWDSDKIPKAIMEGMKLDLATHYTLRDAVAAGEQLDILPTVKRRYSPWRVTW